MKTLTGEYPEDPGKVSRGEGNKIKAALMKENQRRKVTEAKAVLAAEEERAASAK